MKTSQKLPFLIALSVMAAATLGAADAGANHGADPRGVYSTNGWELVWNDEFEGSDPFGY